MLIMANWGLAELRLAEAVRVTEDQTDAREGTAEVLDFLVDPGGRFFKAKKQQTMRGRKHEEK